MSVPSCKLPWYRSCRYWLAAISFLGFIHVYAQRVGISVGIVCMVNQTAVRMNRLQIEADENVNDSYGTHKDFDNATCSLVSTGGKEKGFEDGPFVWDKEIQGHILGSFFYGYLVSQVPGGMLAERYGGKWVFAGFVFMSTVATLFSPIAARISYIFLIVLRIIAGIGSGAVYPAMHAIWSQWAPPHERSKLTNISYAGSWMGNVLALPLAGMLCEHGFDGGWGSIFYVIGISSCGWLLVWCIFVHDSPSKHPHIRGVERDYIQKSLEGQITHANRSDAVPWLAILRSGPVWAVIFGAICVDWGLYLFLTQMPSYMYEVLKFDVQSNGLFSALPFIGMWISMTLTPFLADKIIKSKVLPIGKTRKLFQAIGGFGAAMFLVALSFIDCDHPLLAVSLLTLGIAINGCHFSGFLVNPMDIAPKYAGTIFGIANGFSAVCGFIAPYVVALLTSHQTREEWQIVFFVTAAVYVTGALLYMFLASGELQPWAKETTAEESVELNSCNSDNATVKLQENSKVHV